MLFKCKQKLNKTLITFNFYIILKPFKPQMNVLKTVNLINDFFRCDCPRGYRLDTNGQKCVDENECVERPRICGNGTW
jgi:hypothetical protein